MTRSPLLRRPGAVEADGLDTGVAAHYGELLSEQRRLVETGGVVDRSHRGVVAVAGADRLTFMHSLTTQAFDKLPPMTGGEALILSPQGKIEHHLVFVEDGTTTWLDIEPSTAQALIEFLDSMRFIMRVEVTDATDRFAVVSLVGPATTSAVARLGADLGTSAYATVALPDGGFARRMPWPSPDAADLLLPRATFADVVEEFELPISGVEAFEALRVEAGRPREGLDTDHRTLPHEVGWIGGAVHMSKGCYRGQETVAHVHNLGRPPRRLVLLSLDGSQEHLPALGTRVYDGQREVGVVTTAVRHYESGQVALALVAYKTPDDATLRVGDGDTASMASVEPIVALDTGPRPGQAARARLRAAQRSINPR